MTKPRVFFPIMSSRFNVEPARSFGEIVYLLKTESFSPFNCEIVSRIFRQELVARSFNPKVDYVAMTGPSLFVAILYGHVLVAYGEARILMFDARSSRYVERIVRAAGPMDDSNPLRGVIG